MESSPILAAKRSALSATLKKLNSTSATQQAPPQAQKSLHQHLQSAKSAGNLTPLNNRRVIKTGSLKRVANNDDNDDGDDNKAVKQMHTFTIVNINDIINQKKDVVIEQTSTLHAADRGNQQNNQTPVVRGRLGRPPRKEALQRPDSDVDYQPGADSDAGHSNEDDERNRSSNSRRKTQHTILSERTKAAKPATAASGGGAATPKLLNSQYRNVKHNGAAPGDKPAPRILNSTLCRNVSQLEAHPQIHTIKRSGGENNLNTSNNNNNNHVVKSYSNRNAGVPATNAAGGPAGAIIRRVQPPPKTVISHQVVPGGQTRRVRKITCYETWFVIKLPPQDEKAVGPVVKTELSFSLVRLGNDIAGIQLPSDTWTYKVSLQRRRDASAAALAEAAGDALAGENGTRRSAGSAADVYTGDLHDATIPEKDRWQYAPTNIMFRRSSSNQALRMQFDRAVIFKNNAFYVNIEGKNVRLLGAPTKLDSLNEVETLLQIVNDVALSDSLVEQTAYA